LRAPRPPTRAESSCGRHSSSDSSWAASSFTAGCRGGGLPPC
jgi:hypothetical protein